MVPAARPEHPIGWREIGNHSGDAFGGLPFHANHLLVVCQARCVGGLMLDAHHYRREGLQPAETVDKDVVNMGFWSSSSRLPSTDEASVDGPSTWATPGAGAREKAENVLPPLCHEREEVGESQPKHQSHDDAHDPPAQLVFAARLCVALLATKYEQALARNLDRGLVEVYREHRESTLLDVDKGSGLAAGASIPSLPIWLAYLGPRRLVRPAIPMAHFPSRSLF